MPMFPIRLDTDSKYGYLSKEGLIKCLNKKEQEMTNLRLEIDELKRDNEEYKKLSELDIGNLLYQSSKKYI